MVNGLDYSGTEKDSGKYTIETYRPNQVVDDKDVNSADDEHQSNSQRVADEPDESPFNQGALEKKSKTVVSPHKQSKQIKSNKQTLNEIINGLKTFSYPSISQHQMTMEA